MSDIRVTYSGLIAFVVGLVSVFTGMFFVIIVTRRLTPDEFGTWSLIGTMIGYFLISETLISFWNTRQIARGEEVGKTSLVSSITFAFASIPFYVILVYFVSQSSNAIYSSLILGAILLPVIFVSSTLSGVNLGHKPQVTSYGSLIFEITKIPVALLLVLFFDLGVTGAIVTILIAYLLRIAVQLYFARTKLVKAFSLRILRRWLKLGWLPLYSQANTLLQSLDILFYTFLTGSVIGIAYYSAALAIAALVKHSSKVSQALYPKLLSGASHEFVYENFIRFTYFAIPLLGLTIIFAKPAMFALNPLYEAASTIAIVLSFKLFFSTIRINLNKVVQGIDTVDIDQNPKFSSLLKSKIFFVQTIKHIHSISHIVIIVTIIIILFSYGLSELEIVTWWALASASLEIPFLIYMWIYTQKHIKFSFPFINSAKYVGATLVFMLVFVFTSESIITYHISIYDFLPGLILQLALCIGIYLGITYLIDSKTRNLFKAILVEITSKK